MAGQETGRPDGGHAAGGHADHPALKEDFPGGPAGVGRGGRFRSWLILLSLIFLMALLGGRLVYLQVALHPQYAARAFAQHWKKIPLAGRRGAVRDRCGELLAISRTVPSVWADPAEVAEAGAAPRDMAWILGRLLDMPAPFLSERLSESRRFVWLKRKVSLAVADAIFDRKLPGVQVMMETQRSYPRGFLLSHVLGFTDIDNIGREGVERYFDRSLAGEQGFRWLEKDGRIAYRLIYSPRVMEVLPKDGNDLFLTIDYRLQQIAEEEMDNLVNEWHPLGATLIAMECDTGRVVAMASRPSFDPNLFFQADAGNWQNRGVLFEFEPGSTLKPLVISRLLDLKDVTPATQLNCENGCWMVWNARGRLSRVIRDFHTRHRDVDMLSVADILIQSSNVGAAKLGLQLGIDRTYDHLTRMGFGRPTEIQLPGESGGFLRPRSAWTREYSLISVFLGYEIRVTPLQMVRGMACLVNGGYLLAPQILERIEDSEGRVLASFSRKVLDRPISEETSRVMREILARVVTEGTGDRAVSPHFRLGGKTGTAKKMGKMGAYSDNLYVTSFVGFGPAEAPRLSLMVVVDEPRKTGFRPLGGAIPTGGLVAAPVAGRVLHRMLHYLAQRESREKLWAKK